MSTLYRAFALGAAAILAVTLAGTAHAAVSPQPKFVAGPTQVSGLTPFANCTAGGPGTVSPGAEVEPWTAVNPKNPANIVTEWQQDRWNNGGARGLVAGVTHDFGRHWKKVVIPKISKCSGGIYDRASDPGVSFSADGRTLYAISLSVDNFDPNLGFVTSAILISRSQDGGDTWSDPLTVKRDDNPALFNDKELILADPTDPKRAYAVWDRIDERFSQPVWFTQTNDGGKTWSPARIIHDPTAPGATDPRFTIGNQLVVEPDGSLIDMYFEGSNADNDDRGDWGHQGPDARRTPRADAPAVEGFRIQVIRSTDHGKTWSKPFTVAPVSITSIVDPDAHKPLRTADIIADIAVDHRSGRLFVTWQDASAATSGSGILLTSSADGGRKWSKPIKVNKTPDSAPQGTGQAFTPVVDVSSTGAVAVTYYDFRKDTPGPGGATDYWAVTCQNGASCAQHPSQWREQHVGGSFDVTLAPIARGYFLGDYMGLDHAGPVFVADFAMTHPVANNQQDIYTAAITP
jgi:BNR/Asp-box repeat